VNHAAGIICLAKPGDRVEPGQPVLELRGDDPARFVDARAALAGALEITPEPPPAVSAVLDRVDLGE
jgi:thymidine phosphorylase